MNYIWLAVRWLFLRLGIGLKFFFSLGKFLPMSMAGIFIVSTFFVDLARSGINTAVYGVVTTIFTAELHINEVVHRAIINYNYGIMDFISIIVSLYILYSLGKFFFNLQVHGGAEQSKGFAVLLSIFIVAIISIAGTAVADQRLGFIPIYHSVVFLAMNIDPVIMNIFAKSTAVLVANNTTMINSTINSTFT